jgi:hypothetical protein
MFSWLLKKDWKIIALIVDWGTETVEEEIWGNLVTREGRAIKKFKQLSDYDNNKYLTDDCRERINEVRDSLPVGSFIK